MFSVKRNIDNPILLPIENEPWEASAVFNWSPIKKAGVTHVFYRALSSPIVTEIGKVKQSVVGKAETLNGHDFYNRKPFIAPKEDWEKYGCEDPRAVEIEGKTYIFYTALSKYPFEASGIKVAVAITSDLSTVEERHLVTPFNAKAMTMFPEKINGKYIVLFSIHTDSPPSKICRAELDTIDQLWSQDFWSEWYKDWQSKILNIDRSPEDQVENGSTPIKTKDGWLVIYSHIQDYYIGNPVFGIEAFLLDLETASKIIARTDGPIAIPEAEYEYYGMVPNIIFPSGATLDGDNLEIYYGAADTVSCKMSLYVQDLIRSMKKIPIVKRYEKNPILLPIKEHAWESGAVFNPAAFELDGKIHLLYRAVSNTDASTVGYATTKDGFNIDERFPDPIYKPRIKEEFGPKANGGCEDPRVVIIQDKLAMTYTAYDGYVPRIATTQISKEDFLNRKFDRWSLPKIISNYNIPNKDCSILEEKINNQYFVFHRLSDCICGSYVSDIEFTDNILNSGVEILDPRPGMWDSIKVGIGGPPIKTEKGWLLLYHGVSHEGYSVGAALLDLKDPTIVLSRTNSPIIKPETVYEKVGVVPNVVFPCGNVVRGDDIFVYYGGADLVIGVFTLKLSEILSILK